MRIVVTGGEGQLGKAIQTEHLHLSTQTGTLAGSQLIPIDLPDWDITDPHQVSRLAELKPDCVIHCAAMTNVDGCARQPDLAFRVNALGAQNVALACQQAGASMVCISTNEVFDGTATEPYHEFAATHPINPYAASKLAGEQIAGRLLHRLYIARTAWLFSRGGNNFVSKILTRADQHGELKVVTDEISNPTYAPDLAAAILHLIQTGHYGTYHLVNEGFCSRYDFAVEILKQSDREGIPIHPITSHDFERVSTPPAFAPLQNTVGTALGIKLRPWQEALAAWF